MFRIEEHRSNFQGIQMNYVQRLIKVLDCFIATDSDLGISQLSRELNFSKSIVHRLLVSLEEAGYVVSDPETRRYRLGYKALQLGVAAQSQIDLRRVAYIHMEKLCEATQETVTLSVLTRDQQRFYLEVVESPQEIRQNVEVGRAYPLYLGGSGKAILAFLQEDKQEHILDSAVGHVRADGWPIDLTALRRELKDIRTHGYAISRSERLLGAAAIAAPIFGYDGCVVGSISVAGLAIRMGADRIDQFTPLVVKAAEEISRSMGYVSPVSKPESTLVPIG
jgi:DNA-binding IclR family transcriptional regulator